MTKFEEKLEKLPIKNIEHPVGDTKYYAAVHVKTLIAQADEEIANLKSQLQQQALPVVPECVAEFVSGDETELSKADRIAYLLKSVEGDNYYLEEYLTNAGIISQEQGEHLYAWATNQTHETILELWNGYTVEKPQLFYLKATDSRGHEYLNLDTSEKSIFLSGKKQYDEFQTKFTLEEIKGNSLLKPFIDKIVPVEDGE